MSKILRIVKKIFLFIVIISIIYLILSRGHIYDKSEISYGVTFSQKQAQDLGFNWKDVYLAMLDELKVKKLRLPAYWDLLETRNGNFEFADLDWQIQEASKRDVDLIVVAGNRVPRWPECHLPEWTNEATEEQREVETLEYIREVVNRYKNNENIVAWQVENEPFLPMFGECPEFKKSFLDKEIEMVKKLDDRPIIITDSGELSLWIPAARRADIFGTTMYRDTYSRFLKSYIHYPITPSFFMFKRNIVRMFANPDKWIVIELQAEPWGRISFQNLEKEERDKTMNLDKFRDIIEFSSQTGFDEFYLWGVEWWYWEKQTQNNPSLWEEAKTLF